MTTGARINNDFKKILEEHYNVLGYYHFLDFDFDFDLLKEELIKQKPLIQTHRDKFIFIHVDLDFYLPGSQIGNSVYNLYKTFHECDISMGHIFFITTHHNIEKEFRALLTERYIEFNLPTFFYTIGEFSRLFSDCLTHSTDINVENNISKISKHALALLGFRRVHRNALYQFIKENQLINKIAVTYNNIKPDV